MIYAACWRRASCTAQEPVTTARAALLLQRLGARRWGGISSSTAPMMSAYGTPAPSACRGHHPSPRAFGATATAGMSRQDKLRWPLLVVSTASSWRSRVYWGAPRAERPGWCSARFGCLLGVLPPQASFSWKVDVHHHAAARRSSFSHYGWIPSIQRQALQAFIETAVTQTRPASPSQATSVCAGRGLKLLRSEPVSGTAR